MPIYINIYIYTFIIYLFIYTSQTLKLFWIKFANEIDIALQIFSQLKELRDFDIKKKKNTDAIWPGIIN